MRRLALLVLGALLLAAPAAAQGVAVRVGDHAGHGRLVFDLPGPPAYTAVAREGGLTLRFASTVAPEGMRRTPRNVLRVQPTAEGVEIDVRPGARVRHYPLGNRLVVDVFDPSRPSPRDGTTPSPAGPAVEAASPPDPRPTTARAGGRVAAGAARPLPPGPDGTAGVGDVPAAVRSPTAIERSRAAASGATRPSVREPPDAPRPPQPGPATATAPALPMPPAAIGPPGTRSPPGAPTPVRTRPEPDAARPAAPATAPPVAAPTVATETATVPAPAAGIPALPGGVAAADPAPPPAELSSSPPAILPSAAPSAPPARFPPPDAVPVRLRAPPNESPFLLFALPPGTAAASLRRGDDLILVFDRAQAFDLAALRAHPTYGALSVTVLPDATLLRLPLAAPAELRARPVPGGWRVEASRPDAARTAPDRPLRLAIGAGAAPPALPASGPGGVVPVADPETGLPLLLGTVRDGAQAIPHGRRFAEFDLVPTTLGVALLARSEALTLRPLEDRFTLGAGGTRLALDAGAVAPEGMPAMTRVFDLPNAPVPQLLERLRAQNAGIGATPALRRGPLRADAASTMLALGLGQEAQAMLRLAATEDPRPPDPAIAALGGAAALLAGREGEAGGLHAPGLPESDELALWRGLLAAARGDAAGSAPGLAAALPLLGAYPAPLRARLVPLAATALAEGGEVAAVRSLLSAAPEGADLRLPAAMVAEAEGDADRAAALYAEVAAGRDRLARVRAIGRGTELALRLGRIDVREAARRLEAALFAWRGDAREAELRLRLAQLRREAGDPRAALALLRETESLFPDRAAMLRPEGTAALLAGLESLPPLDAVALHDANPELLPTDGRAEAAAALLADRLVALDLTDRAAGLLAAALERAEPRGVAAAELGARLATVRLEGGDAPGALAALARSAGPQLPAESATRRTLAQAQAELRRGRPEVARPLLAGLGAAGAEPLADLLAAEGDVAAAHAAFAPALAALPPGPLAPAAARTALRGAALAVLAGDAAALTRLRQEVLPRVPAGAAADAMAALTADPQTGLAELPRLQRELALFRSLPARLESLRTVAAAAR